jgi:exodeoxyribonuclease VII small subunit
MNDEPIASEAETDSDLTYEEAYQQLEQILQALESGDLPLDESLSLYERGSELAAYCTRLLDEAELRVEKWQSGVGSSPLDDWEEG